MTRSTILRRLRAMLPLAVVLVAPIEARAQDRRPAQVEYVNIFESRDIDDPIQFVELVVFQVPAGRRLLLDYVSLDLDAVVLQVGPVGPGIKITATLNGFVIGILEEIELTTRGTPHFVLGKGFPVSFGPGETLRLIVSPRLSSYNFDFGRLLVNISGKLIPEQQASDAAVDAEDAPASHTPRRSR